MSAPVPSRAAIDRAGDLDFDRRPARQELTITVKARFNGFDTELCFSGQLDQLDAITKRLVQLGGEPAKGSDINGQSGSQEKPARRPATRVTPAYDADGEPLCPVHHKPLVEGRYGLYCSSKAQAGEQQNDKGYCALKFEA